MKKRLSRRTLLRGLGGTALALPMLNIMGPQRVSADVADGLVNGRIQRFVVVFKGNGVHQPSFFPAAGATSFLGTDLAPLEAYRNRAMILDGVRLKSASDSMGEQHQTGMGSLLSGRRLQNTGAFTGGNDARAGWGNGVTIDQTIAGRIRGTTRFGSLELGIRATRGGSEVRTRLNYRGPADPLSPSDDPRAVFERLFAGFDTGAADRERLRARRQRVADAVQDQYRRVHARVGHADQQRLERHLSFINELEGRIGAIQSTCSPAADPGALDVGRDSSAPAVSRAQIDLLVASFACDLTRVASLQYSTGSYVFQCPWLDDRNTGHTLGHGTSHRDEPAVVPGDRDKTQKNALWSRRIQWYMGEIEYLLRRLEDTPDGDGTLLDSTAVLFVSENASPHHDHARMPFVLFGDAHGAFQTGVHHRFAQPEERGANEYHNRMLVALQRGYGIDSDVFGEPEYCEGGALPGMLA